MISPESQYFYVLPPEKMIHHFIIFRENGSSTAIEVSKNRKKLGIALRSGGVPVHPVGISFVQQHGSLG